MLGVIVFIVVCIFAWRSMKETPDNNAECHDTSEYEPLDSIYNV